MTRQLDEVSARLHTVETVHCEDLGKIAAQLLTLPGIGKDPALVELSHELLTITTRIKATARFSQRDLTKLAPTLTPIDRDEA